LSGRAAFCNSESRQFLKHTKNLSNDIRRLRETANGVNYGLNSWILLFFWGRATTFQELRLHSSGQVPELLCPNWIAMETISARPPNADGMSILAAEAAKSWQIKSLCLMKEWRRLKRSDTFDI